MDCGVCRGGRLLVRFVTRRVKNKLSSAKAYLFRDAPNLQQPIQCLHNVLQQYETRITELDRRREANQQAAQRAIALFKESKNPSHRLEAQHALKTKAMNLKHANMLRQRMNVLEQHKLTLEEAGVQRRVRVHVVYTADTVSTTVRP